MQICTSLQTDKHADTPPLSFYRPDALPAAQSTASMHWRHKHWKLLKQTVLTSAEAGNLSAKSRETDNQCFPDLQSSTLLAPSCKCSKTDMFTHNLTVLMLRIFIPKIPKPIAERLLHVTCQHCAYDRVQTTKPHAQIHCSSRINRHKRSPRGWYSTITHARG